jgi:hypothetical protein
VTTITTAGIWIDLPTSGGAADRFRADQPLGAGLVQIASSNAEFACRENNLRTLWEHSGFTDIDGTLILFGSPSSNVFEFPWDSVPGFGPPVAVAYAGAHRMRGYGSTGVLPLITISARLKAGGGTAGVVLVANSGGRPQPRDPYVVLSSTSTPYERKTGTLALTLGDVFSRPIAPLVEDTTPPGEPIEPGVDTIVHLWVGVWNDSGAKTSTRGMTIYLGAPP